MREECHTILVWKEKWEEIRQKSVKDWKINEAENPMVWMQEISLLCHLCSKPFLELFPFPIFSVSWSKAWGWAGKSRWKSSFIQINSDFSSKIEIVDDAYRKKCIWMMILFVMNLMIASWPKNQALNFIVCFQLWFLFFTTRSSSSSILGFSVAFSRENCVANLNWSTTEMGRQMTFKKL